MKFFAVFFVLFAGVSFAEENVDANFGVTKDSQLDYQYCRCERESYTDWKWMVRWTRKYVNNPEIFEANLAGPFGEDWFDSTTCNQALLKISGCIPPDELIETQYCKCERDTFTDWKWAIKWYRKLKFDDFERIGQIQRFDGPELGAEAKCNQSLRTYSVCI